MLGAFVLFSSLLEAAEKRLSGRKLSKSQRKEQEDLPKKQAALGAFVNRLFVELSVVCSGRARVSGYGYCCLQARVPSQSFLVGGGRSRYIGMRVVHVEPAQAPISPPSSLIPPCSSLLPPPSPLPARRLSAFLLANACMYVCVLVQRISWEPRCCWTCWPSCAPPATRGT